ncbi:hypothetical protein CATYP_07165 [Corynebacterium atypicum]|uniref:Secreted protein n=1 Tax=Corynebacterium atypicum TaxID=191610 RepID=A0ABM5QNK6_9CORY|nr:hypothetical protein [Corynebacterium atypicum]AIG64404.1 hypothetical protein CATYP_07165 [Corynebacterium atypicum]
MSIQRRPTNQIEARKAAVRSYARTGTTIVVGGVAAGALLWAWAGVWQLFALGLIVAVVGGAYYWQKITKVINHKDEY